MISFLSLRFGQFNGGQWMELTSQMKMARFQTFWIQMRKNKPLDVSRKTDQTSGTKMAFYSIIYIYLYSTFLNN
ncbi:hypothetical protein Hanom_Chr04g00353471 [Helianthus anomalus]